MHRLNLNIITIAFRYPSEDLSHTLSSLESQSEKNFFLKLVISSVDDVDLLKLREYLSTTFDAVQIISNQDRGIYDAMNIGLEMCENSPILFLNAGDTLVDSNVIEYINDTFVSGVANAYSVLNTFDFTEYYLRRSNPRYYRQSFSFCIRKFFSLSSSIVRRLPPHQGLIAYYNDPLNRMRFSASEGFHADSSMIAKICDDKNIYYHDKPIAIFSLGGVSSRPSIKRFRSYAKRHLFVKAFCEPFLILISLFMPTILMYRLINFMSGNIQMKRI